MKELSIEEKAKRYDEAFDRARKLKEDPTSVFYEYSPSEGDTVADYIFPELKKSEDEMMIQYFKDLAPFDKADELYEKYGFSHKDAIAWLEKQGEQKPQGKTALEAIKEEKVDNANKVEPRQEKLTEFEKAVKQVMEEAIECGDTHNLKADAEMLLSLVHNSSWSEEDKKKVNNLYVLLDQMVSFNMLSDKDATEFKDWLKSLKDRVQPQPKHGWSEEDKKIIDRIESEFLALHRGEYKNIDFNDVDSLSVLNWVRKIKSLCFYYRWKPSDEQMKQLGWVAEQNKNNMIGKELMTLYQDLKKLKG